MSGSGAFDAAVVGGGVMGCTVALHLARGGMRVVVLEKGGLCMEASGVNAGTLSIQIKRAALVPYALRGWELWRTAPEWLGMDVGFRQCGGLTLAFTDEEAAMLEERMRARREQGAPIEFIDLARAREIEPGLSDRPVAVSWCPMDGYSNSSLNGQAFRRALRAAGVEVREGTAVDAIRRGDRRYRIEAGSDVLEARRLVLAAGVWLEEILARDFGLAMPVNCRVNQVSVTERVPRVVHGVLGVATGLLTLKQSANGTVLIGGGWQGIGSPMEGGRQVVPDNLIGNLRLAAYAVPALADARVVRTWLGLEGNVADFMPLAGPLPGLAEAYVIGCVRGGYTIGPFMGRLLAQRILGREPEMPLFDPARAIRDAPAAASVA